MYYQKSKTALQNKKMVENKPRLGQGRARNKT